MHDTRKAKSPPGTGSRPPDALEEATTAIVRAYEAAGEDSDERTHLAAAQAHVDRARRARSRPRV